ncbi:MAG: DUF5916 domain-containing protein [Longimicrobiaceae bacterium]
MRRMQRVAVGTAGGLLRAAPFIIAAALLLPLSLAAQTPAQPAAEAAPPVTGPAGRPIASAAHASDAPRIDGRLDEEVWQSAPVLSDFAQREPFEGRPASERTEVRILYDDAALYIGAWLYDREPSGIVVGETRRDADLSDSDALLIILDTYLDRQNGFVFGTTPAGIEYDGQVTKEGQGGIGLQTRQQASSGGGFNKNWDGSWQVATSRDAAGWYAEFRIPFSTLRYAGGGSQSWGLNLARKIRRRNEESFWSPIPRQFDLYRVSMAGTLAGFDAPARRTASVTPYVLGAGRRDYLLSTETDFDGSFGGDAKIGLTPSLTLDLTYNTDFAQVEVDEEQVNLSRFRLFFPEKRPFFLENAGTFSVGSPQEVELFFSRRIGIASGREVPILGGGRLSGRVGAFNVGLLNIQTERVRLLDPAVDQWTQLAPANNFSVGRVIRELPNRSRIGATVVSRLSTADTDDYNLTYGVDGRLGIGQAVSLDGYAARSETPGLDGPAYAYSLSGGYTTRDWRLTGAFREVARDFNPEVGFLSRSEYRLASARVQRNFRFAELPWFRELRPHVVYREFFGLDGFSETRLVHIDSHFEFANGAFFQLPAVNLTREGLRDPFAIAPGVVIPPGTYDNVEWGFAYNTDLSAPLSLEGRIDIGGFYSGRRKGTASTLNARLGEKLAAGLRVTYYDVDLAEGSFNTSLVGLRAAYSFTPRIYLQSLVQYNDQSQLFSTNLRFGWLSTAGTGLFVVYNDIEQTALFDRYAVARRPLDRALIIKFTRQFNLGE